MLHVSWSALKENGRDSECAQGDGCGKARQPASNNQDRRFFILEGFHGVEEELAVRWILKTSGVKREIILWMCSYALNEGCI
jgi:hypothetical protein